MACISSITLGGASYDIKDSEARASVAELESKVSVNPAFVNVLDNGLVNDGETDNTEAFNALYAANPYATLYFPQGTYCFSSQLTVGLMHIFLDRATMKWTGECEYAIYMTGYLPDEPQIGDDGFDASMNVINGHKPTYGNYITGRGGTVDCNYKAKSGIYLGTQRMTEISYLTIHNFSGYGVHQPAISYTNSNNETAYFSFEVNCHNCLFDNDYDDTNNSCLSSTGIYLNGDSTIRDCVMVNAHTGISSGGANTISNIHAWLFDFKTTKDYKIIDGSCFYQGCNDVISDCYIDTYLNGLYIWGGKGTRISNLGWFVNWSTWSSAFKPSVIKVDNEPSFALFGARLAAYANETFISGTPGKYITTGLMIDGTGCADAVDTVTTLLNNVPTPAEDNDAANKKYVDDKLSTTKKIKATLEDGTETVLEVVVVSEETAAGITLSGTSGTGSVGDTITLAATLNNIEGDITWSSSDETIATVSNGTITCVAAGSCTITAACGEYSAEYSLTVETGEVACTEISAGNFSYDTGIIMSSTGSKTATFYLSPENTTDTFSVKSDDESIVTVGDITYGTTTANDITYKQASVVLNPVSAGSTTVECTCGSKTFKATVAVMSGASWLANIGSYDKASDTIEAQMDLSTCSNAQENVFYFGSESGASGWSGASSGNAGLYLYYYKDTKKLEVDGVVWGACMTESTGRNYTLTDDQVSDVKVEINSTDGIKVSAGGTTLFQYAYVDSSSTYNDIWSNWNTTAVGGYGQDNSPSNATYADGWLLVNDIAQLVGKS